jgi:hypothetical protein
MPKPRLQDLVAQTGSIVHDVDLGKGWIGPNVDIQPRELPAGGAEVCKREDIGLPYSFLKCGVPLVCSGQNVIRVHHGNIGAGGLVVNAGGAVWALVSGNEVLRMTFDWAYGDALAASAMVA